MGVPGYDRSTVRHGRSDTRGKVTSRVNDIFVLGLDDFNRRKLERVDDGQTYRFHGVLDPHAILEGTEFPIEEMLEQAEREIRGAGTEVDAILGYVDFPVSTMVPLLARTFELPAISLEALLRCEHKYWSRLVQAEVVPDHVPSFEVFDPFDDRSVDSIGLAYPYWVKPVRSAGSFLGFRVESRRQLQYAVEQIRAHIGMFSDPFGQILERAELPPQLQGVGPAACLAESLIGGHQCTLEGAVQDGTVAFHGMIDSIRDPGQSSFRRYQYPSQLPDAVQQRMRDIAARVLTHGGFDRSCFNVEFFWDDNVDQVWLLEINVRIAQHHSDLFEKVDGISNHKAALDVAMGRSVDLPHGRGPFGHAACSWLRAHDDGVVERVPSEAEIAALADEIPGLQVELHVEPGTRLSELSHQDSYSYVLGLFYLGADSPAELDELDRRCREALRFEIRSRP